MMLPPSATLPVAVKLTVVASIVSVIVVTAAVASVIRFSKLPPETPVIVLLTEPASITASSLGAGTLTVPLDAPAAMLMV